MLHQYLSFDYFILHFPALRLNSTSSINSFCLNTFINTHNLTNFHVFVGFFLVSMFVCCFLVYVCWIWFSLFWCFLNFILGVGVGVGRVLYK